jgi:tetratricopeptide (TPR) repeat protein
VDETPDSTTAPAVERSNDPRVVAAREALDGNRLDLARGLVEQAAPLVGTEGPLLRARLAVLDGQEFEAQTLIEEARRMDPADPRVYATAAELHAAAGRLAEADREIRRGVEACGPPGPELARARGVHLISTPGNARAGLELLLGAQGQDPDLPFLGRAMGQAHMLVSKGHLARGEFDEALLSIELSLASDPDDLESRRLRADVLMALSEWGQAIGIYEELMREGMPLGAELAVYCKNAGFYAMITERRKTALHYFSRALELGLPPSEFGHGRDLLLEESDRLVGEAVTVLSGGDEVGALEVLKKSLLFDPESLAAHNYAGHAHKALGQFEDAAREWNWVLDTGRLRKVELPGPVHLDLAKVQALGLGNFEEARATLEAYMTFEPTGEYREQTRQLLDSLPEDVETEVLEVEAQDEDEGDGE